MLVDNFLNDKKIVIQFYINFQPQVHSLFFIIKLDRYVKNVFLKKKFNDSHLKTILMKSNIRIFLFNFRVGHCNCEKALYAKKIKI
jgi:hypothetical protein